MLTTNLNYSLELQQNWDWETNTADLHVNAYRGTCKKHALIMKVCHAFCIQELFLINLLSLCFCISVWGVHTKSLGLFYAPLQTNHSFLLMWWFLLIVPLRAHFGHFPKALCQGITFPPRWAGVNPSLYFNGCMAFF